jgi:hypothetical protein
MDLEEIFSLFNNSSDSDGKYTVSDEDLFFYIRMFKGYILRFDELKKGFLPIMHSFNPEAAEKLSTATINPLCYYKAYSFLNKIDLNNKDHYESFSKNIDLEFIKACNKSIEYFISTEEYEKCNTLNIFLQEGIKILKVNLPDINY